MGFAVTHLYGLTECYGPATICLWQPGLEDMPLPKRPPSWPARASTTRCWRKRTVLEPGDDGAGAGDGTTLGEVMLRGNTVMKGYLRNPAANREAFAGGWFHTGDLGVMHPDGYIEVKDRAKDIVISGGENVSTLEVEEVLYAAPRHHGSRRRGAAGREMGRGAACLRHADARPGADRPRPR